MYKNDWIELVKKGPSFHTDDTTKTKAFASGIYFAKPVMKSFWYTKDGKPLTINN